MSNKSDGIEIKGKFRYDLNTERFLAAHPAREQGLYFWQRYLRHVLITPETNMTFHSNGQIKSIDRIANGYVETQGVQVNFPRKSEDRSYGDTSYLELDEEGRLKRLIPSSQSKVILTDQAVKTAFAEPYGERIRFKKFIDIDSISLELIEYYPVSEIIEEIKFYNDGSIHSLSTNKRALSSISQREGVITFTAKKPSANSLDDWTVSFMEEK